MFLSFSLSSVSLCYSFHSAWLVYIMLVALLGWLVGLLLSNVIKSSPLTVLQTNRVERRQRHRPFLPPPAPLLPVGDPNSTDRPTDRPTNKPSVPSGPVPSQSWMDGWLACFYILCLGISTLCIDDKAAAAAMDERNVLKRTHIFLT